MIVRKLAILAALCALAALSASSASAAVFAHLGTTTGNVAPSGTQITASLVPNKGTSGTGTGTSDAMLHTGLGDITCTNDTFVGTLGTSGGSTLSGTLNSLTFQACTDTIPFITVSSCNSYIDANNSASFVTDTTATNLSTTVTVACDIGGGSFCYFRSVTASGPAQGAIGTTASGTTLTSSTLSYMDANTTQPSSPASSGLCPASGTFSALFGNVVKSGTTTIVGVNTTA